MTIEFTVADLLYLLDMISGKEAIALMKFKDICNTHPFDAERAQFYTGILEGLSFTRGHIYELFVQRLGEASNV